MHIRSVRTLVFALVALCVSASSFAQIGVMITISPPAIPVYEQPICPGDGYLWTPGYWAWGDDFDDYYWVPGTWVEAPEVGFLWTPGYWGWNADRFVFTEGYWGPHVGFYGGINYGFGYFGNGYEGGRWDNGHFFYNRAVTRVNLTVIHNVYNTKVVENERTRVSYNGGHGGINARPTPEQETVVRERHVPPVAAQTQHLQAARSNNQQRASVNRGKPEVAATAKPGEFSGRDVVKAKKAGAAYTPQANRGGNQARENASGPRPNNNSNADRPDTAVHPGDLPPAARPAAPNTGNAKLDQKYQQQQQKQSAKQDQERQKLQQKQEKEHQQLAQHNANDARKQQVEQKHQQQTQQLQQRHEQQQQRLQARQQPSASRTQPKR